MKKVLVIMGVTGTGKSDTALRLAQAFDGEIISADSVAVYRGLDIGSAKPSQRDLDLVPHHLIDILEPSQQFTVADFQAMGRKKIEDIWSQNKLPIVVGGTGFYIKALLYDYQFHREEKVCDFSSWSNQAMHDLLSEKDPLQAQKIHVNNRQRLLRVMQLMETSQSTRSALVAKQKQGPLYDCEIFYLTGHRPLLYDRINERVDRMMDQGLLDEVSQLTQQGQIWPVGLKAIGYQEWKPYFQEGQSLDQTVEKIKSHTRQFAKRQETFFRHQFDRGHLVDIFDQAVFPYICERIQQWTNSHD